MEFDDEETRERLAAFSVWWGLWPVKHQATPRELQTAFDAGWDARSKHFAERFANGLVCGLMLGCALSLLALLVFYSGCL